MVADLRCNIVYILYPATDTVLPYETKRKKVMLQINTRPATWLSKRLSSGTIWKASKVHCNSEPKQQMAMLLESL